MTCWRLTPCSVFHFAVTSEQSKITRICLQEFLSCSVRTINFSKLYFCVMFRNNSTNGHVILQNSFLVRLWRLKQLMKPEFLNDSSCLLVVEGLAPRSALHSLHLLNYLFHCWRLLFHLYVISELYTCE